MGEEEVKLSLYADNLILCIENSKDSTKKLLELINSVKLDTKLINSNLLHFYILTNYQKQIKKTIPFTIVSKIIK